MLLDFGLAAEMRNREKRVVQGTPLYMAPEQAAGGPLSQASDWYSVGVVLYEALTGRRPFSGQFLEVLSQKQRREPRAPSELVSGIPEDLNSICRDLLLRDPQERPSERELLDRLGAVYGEGSDSPTGQAPPSSTWRRAGASAMPGRRACRPVSGSACRTMIRLLPTGRTTIWSSVWPAIFDRRVFGLYWWGRAPAYRFDPVRSM